MIMISKSIILLTATLMCVSCSMDETTDSLEMRKAYLQAHGESQDSTSTGGYNSANARSNPKGMAISNSTAEDSTRCDLFIEGKLIVDGGTSSDISDTFVTVDEVTVNVFADGNEMVTYCPEVHTDVAEPSEVFEWETMPIGLRYDPKMLSAEPLSICYKDYFYAEVTVSYILRVRDTKLAAGCTTDRCKRTVTCATSSHKENRMSVLVPLELRTIAISATVDDYD